MKSVVTTATHPGQAELRSVAAALDAGGLALVPTETVYGIAAQLDRPAAIEALCEAKGRPGGQPLQLLVADIAQAVALAAAWPPAAARLAAAFWPGPLTIVVPATDGLSARVTADDGTVGLRCPAHDTLRTLLTMCGPLVASSANRSGEAPALTCDEAVAALGAYVAVALDTGPAAGGVPSTVVRAGRQIELLRVGALTRDRIEEAAAQTGKGDEHGGPA